MGSIRTVLLTVALLGAFVRAEAGTKNPVTATPHETESARTSESRDAEGIAVPGSAATETGAEAATAGNARWSDEDDDASPTINEIRRQRGLVDVKHVFVPAGQWIFGGMASYSTHVNDGYTFLIVEGIESDGYTFKISPLIGYAPRDNMAFGVRAIYSRTLLRVDGGALSLGDEESGTEITADYYYSLKHTYSLAAIWRQYIPLGRNKRFALFNEMSLTLGGHQSKFAADNPVRGTYETGTSIALGVSPGLIAFATNTMAVEVNIGVMGISYTHSRQVKNQVKTADMRSSNMNFRINPLSIGLGVSFHL